MRLILAGVLAGVLASAISVAAQEPVGRPPQRGPEMTPAEIQKVFDGYLLIQAQESLGLTDQQFAQFVPRLRTLQDTRRRHQQERVRLLNELQRLTRPAAGSLPRVGPGADTADEALLKDRLSRLAELDAHFAADMRKAYNALDEVLGIRQQARFRVFEEQIERKKLDLLLRARQKPNRPQNPNRPLQKRPPG
jgi:Spy/CpxP family protein refolding chaperone